MLDLLDELERFQKENEHQPYLIVDHGDFRFLLDAARKHYGQAEGLTSYLNQLNSTTTPNSITYPKAVFEGDLDQILKIISDIDNSYESDTPESKVLWKVLFEIKALKEGRLPLDSNSTV